MERRAADPDDEIIETEDEALFYAFLHTILVEAIEDGYWASVLPESRTVH